MLTIPNLNSVIRLDLEHVSVIPEDVKEAYDKAREFLEYYDWVESINDTFLGAAFSGILYIYLFEITSLREDVEPWIWVIVGDVPPAYLTCDDATTPYEALDSYIGAMQEWVIAAKAGKSVANLIPVNVPATYESGISLESRLIFIDTKILPELND